MIEVKNNSTDTINLAIDGQIITIKPLQCCMLPEDVYKSYITIFPALRPIIEHAIIESEGQEIVTQKGKKDAGKGKKRGK